MLCFYQVYKETEDLYAGNCFDSLLWIYQYLRK